VLNFILKFLGAATASAEVVKRLRFF